MKQKMKSLLCLMTKRQSAKPCGNQTPSGPLCKACRKTFHYIHTLRTHAQPHTANNIHLCGICGKHLGPSVNLISHLDSKKKRAKCRSHGKQFSNVKQHGTCHWINVLTVAKLLVKWQMNVEKLLTGLLKSKALNLKWVCVCQIRVLGYFDVMIYSVLRK